MYFLNSLHKLIKFNFRVNRLLYKFRLWIQTFFQRIEESDCSETTNTKPLILSWEQTDVHFQTVCEVKEYSDVSDLQLLNAELYCVVKFWKCKRVTCLHTDLIIQLILTYGIITILFFHEKSSLHNKSTQSK